MKKVFLTGFLAITALLFSCDKEESKTTATTTQTLTEKKGLLCAQPWKKYSSIFSNDTVQPIERIQECDKDDFIQYFEDGSVKVVGGDVLCFDESSKQSLTAFWKFDETGTKLSVTMQPNNFEEQYTDYIELLTKDKLILSSKYTENGITTVYKSTFKH
jgi:hypothetical protein